MTDRTDAARGSEMLRNAMLACLGLQPPAPPKKARHRVSRVWWTEKDFQTLRKLAEAGCNSIVIGAIMGRTPTSIRSQAWKRGISLDHRKLQPQPRPANPADWTEADRISEYAQVPQELAELVVNLSKQHSFPVAAVRGHRRPTDLVQCRWAIAQAARRLGYPYAAIGRALNRDHTSIIYAVNQQVAA